MSFPSQGTPSALTDAEEDGAPPKSSQIVLRRRQEALRERQGTAHASAAHSSAGSRSQPGGGMLPGSLLTEAVEEARSEGKAEVARQDKSKMAQAAAQGGQFCISPLPPAQPVPTSTPDCQPECSIACQVPASEAAAPGARGGSRERGWQDNPRLRWGRVQLTSG